MRVTFVISSLAAGGAERVLSTMANYWAEKGKNVTLITLDSERSDFYSLHPAIHRMALGQMFNSRNRWDALRNNFNRLVTLRSAIIFSYPDWVISFTDKMNVLTLAACIGLKIPVIVSERSDPRKHHIGAGWDAARKAFYPFASAVVVQSENVRKWAELIVARNKVYIVPNPVQVPVNIDNHNSVVIEKTVIAMGRLSDEKGFDLLLKAFAKCTASVDQWRLLIIGDGPKRKELEKLADDLGIFSQVRFEGRVKDPYRFLQSSDLYVLSSRYEGFPNALLEAMACGLPAIATDCPSGPSEIIQDGIDGILVPSEDINLLASTMLRLMNNNVERQRLSKNAVKVVDRFSIKNVMGMWEKILNEDAVSYK